MGLFSKIFKGIFKLLGGVLKGVLGWLVPKPEGKDGLLIERQGSDLPIPIVYGTTRIGCIKVHKYVTDTPQEAWNDLLHIIAVFCEGEVDAVEELFFNGVSENDPRWKKGNEKWFKKYVYRGTPDQPASAQAVSGIPNWTINHKLSGLCYVYLVLQMDSNLEVWQGEPEITARIRGRRVLDTRTGVTAYSENPVMILRDYLTNTIYGKGLPPQRIDTAVFNAVANQCDEQITFDATFTEYFEDNTVPGKPVLVPVTTTQTITKAKFKTNIFLDTANSVFDNVGELLSTFRGIMPLSSGLIKISIETTGSPVFELNDDNIIGDVDFSGGSVNDRLNKVEVRFPNKAKGYEKDSVIYPTAGDPILATWLDEDNGVVLNKSFEIDGITNKDEAIQAAIVIAKRSRFTKSLELTAMPEAIVLEPGDIVGVTLEGFGFQSKPFRVAEKIIDEDDNIQLTLTEHENNVYPWTGLNYDDVLGGTFLGDPTRLNAPTGLTITPDLTYATSGTLAWSYQQNAFVRKFRVVVNRDNAVIFDVEVLGQNWSIPKLDAGSYSIQVYAVGTTGYQSDAAAIAMTLAVPVPPSSIQLTSFNFEIEARPVLAGAGLGTQFEFDCVEGDGAGHTPTSKARGTTATFVGLKHDTLYTVFARTINALGISEWVSGSIETTADAGPIIDLIGDTYFEQAINPIVNDLQEQLDDANNAIVDLGNDAKLRIQRVEYDLNSAQKQLLQTTDYARQIQQQASDLTNAFFYVDPENGQIVNLAFAYTDNQFTQAGLLIDGVSAEVAIQAQRVTTAENRITNAESQILVQAGQIDLRATYTDVNEIVAGAIDAILPAYSFGFFAGADGWSAVNGTLTTQPSRILLTWGDIHNQALDYVADENPVISISFERTGGTGWTGSLIVTFDDNSTQTYSGVIEDIPEGGAFVRNLNLSQEATYTGTVTGLRLVLGASVADTFTVTQITIGKPSAALLALEGLTLQVNQLGIDIDAVNASLTNYVTTSFFNNNAVTLNNVETVLDGTDAIISLKATQTELGAQGTITKANAANVWIDAAEANITSVVQSYNAQPGGIDDQLDAIDGEFTAVQQTLDAQNGRISNSVVAISKLDESAKKDGLNLLLAEYSLYLRKKGELELGVGVATANFDIAAVSNSVQADAQSVLELDASFGTAMGQIDANFNQTNQTIANETLARTTAITDLTVSFNGQLAAQSQLIQDVQTDVAGNSSAIASLGTRADNLEDFTQSQLILNSEYDAELETLVSRAFLGVTNTVGGTATIAGITIDDAEYALRFQGNVFSLADTAGNIQLYWDAGRGKFVFNGDIVAGTFQTATSGFRAEMSGTGEFPFWYGNNAKNLANALFAVDTGGNVTMCNATIHNATISGQLNGVTGTFAGNLSAAGGTFTGTLQGVDGSFSGTVQAQQIVGDIYNVKRITDIPASNQWWDQNFNNTTASKRRALSVDVVPSPLPRIFRFENLAIGFGTINQTSGASGVGTVYAQLPSGTVLKTWSFNSTAGNTSAGFLVNHGFASMIRLDGIELPANATRIEFWISVDTVTIPGGGTFNYDLRAGISTLAAALTNHRYVHVETVNAGTSAGISINGA